MAMGLVLTLHVTDLLDVDVGQHTRVGLKGMNRVHMIRYICYRASTRLRYHSFENGLEDEP